MIKENSRKNKLEILTREIEDNKRKQRELEIEINENRCILHELKLKKESSQDSNDLNQERILEDLRNKNAYLTEEVIIYKSDC